MATIKAGQLPSPSLPTQEVHVPEMGGSVIVRCMRVTDRWALFNIDEDDRGRYVTRTLAHCVVDDEGTPIWTEEEWDIFGATNEEVIVSLMGVCRELSELTDDVDDTKKNLSAVPS